MSKEEHQVSESSARDPLDWAIVAIVISGSSLVLALEAKIDARRRAASQEAQRKAQAGNRIRLAAISRSLKEMTEFLAGIRTLGRIEVNPKRIGISRGSIIFDSEDAEKRFNSQFEHVTALISRINTALSEIDLHGFPLSDADIQRYVTDPISRAKDKVFPLLQAELDPHLRIERAMGLLSDYVALVEGLSRIVDAG